MVSQAEVFPAVPYVYVDDAENVARHAQTSSARAGRVVAGLAVLGEITALVLMV